MMNNFKKVHKGLALQDRVWAAARETYPKRFEAKMKAIQEMDEEAYKWLQKNTSPKQWSRTHFQTAVKCDFIQTTSHNPSTQQFLVQGSSQLWD